MVRLFKWRFAAQTPPPDSKIGDSYFEKLVKYIPADIVGAYVAIAGILTENGNQPLWLTWGVFGFLLVLTPLYVCYIKTDPPGFSSSKAFHWLTACLAFTAWVFALGGPFAATFSRYHPYLGPIALILTTISIPVLEGQFYNGSDPPPTPPAPDVPTPTPSAIPVVKPEDDHIKLNPENESPKHEKSL